jgi:hypothetical protein
MREKVLKYQKHGCVSNRCFKSKNKILKNCKYGFPFSLQDDDCMSNDNIRYLYKRSKTEDCSIVPYNAKLLLLWDGHVNVQYVTKRGIEHYLVKYVSKVEPSFFAKLPDKPNEVQKHLLLRIVSSIEAAAFICGRHFV